MTSPATELRTAAATLRALATAASTATSTPIDKGGKPTTRWHFAERNGSSSGYLYAENPNGPGARLIHGGADSRGTHPNMRTRHGQYAAAMDPTVGLALANWLDWEAETAPITAWAPINTGLDRALAVARAVNGSQP